MHQIGYMAQADSLLPWKTAISNVVLIGNIYHLSNILYDSVARYEMFRKGISPA